MENENGFLEFKENIDQWVKQIKRDLSEFSDIPELTAENANNIQHNYELIHELKDEMEELKQEISALKLIQIIFLKNKIGHNAEVQR